MRHAALPFAALAALAGCGASSTSSSTAVTPDAAVPGDTVGPNVDTIAPHDTASPPGDTVVAVEDVAVDPTQDPCHGVPSEGRCAGRTLELCVAGTGGAEPFVASIPCGAGYACTELGGALGASCTPSMECRPGDTECHGTSLAACVDGLWQETPCGLGGCGSSDLGSYCRPNVNTVPYANTVEFEYRAADADFTDWGSDVYRAPARRFLVVSMANGDILDVTTTDDDGHFSVSAVPPGDEDGDDGVAIFALGANADHSIAYEIFHTGLAAGEGSVEDVATHGPPDPTLWSWFWTASDIPGGDGVYLPLDSGSGAAYAYDYLSGVHEVATTFFGDKPGTSLAMWLDYGVTWDCGACFVAAPTHGADADFASQIFFPAGADESYWSGAVLAHELGHWVMATFGVSPGEGGMHVAGVPSHPGLAWSEGFASWFSAVVRDQHFHYDKQNGLFFWVDYDARAYSGGQPWNRPNASLGLEQLIDENEVVEMLLGITTGANLDAMFSELASPRMTVSPFLRGYKRRTWDGLDENYLPLPAWSTDISAPYLADYLDALVCDGVVTASEVDAQTEPAVHYPYPSQAPLCRRARLPVEVTWQAMGQATRALVRWSVPLEQDLTLRFDPATTPATIIPAGSAPGQVALTFTPLSSGPSTLAGPSSVEPQPVRPRGLAVRTGGPGWRVVGQSPFAPPQVAAPPLTGLSTRLPSGAISRSIPLRYVPPAARAPERRLRLDGLRRGGR